MNALITLLIDLLNCTTDMDALQALQKAREWNGAAVNVRLHADVFADMRRARMTVNQSRLRLHKHAPATNAVDPSVQPQER